MMATATRATYPPLSEETRAHLDTNGAAFHAGVTPKTMRSWVNKGPIQPDMKINGRNRYSVAALRRLLGVSQ